MLVDLSEDLTNIYFVLHIANRIRITSHQIKLTDATQIQHIALYEGNVQTGFSATLLCQIQHFLTKVQPRHLEPCLLKINRLNARTTGQLQQLFLILGKMTQAEIRPLLIQ